MNKEAENLNVFKVGRSILMRMLYGNLIKDKYLLESHTALTIDNWRITGFIDNGFIALTVKNGVQAKMHIDDETYVFLMIEY